MPKRKEPCVYCANGIESSRDHVPPRRFFGDIPPPNLIKVPCCALCRVKDCVNDELARDAISSVLNIEGTKAEAEIAGAKARAWANDKTKLKKMFEEATVFTSAKIPLLNFNTAIFDRFFERTCRAVIYHAIKRYYFEANFEWIRNTNLLPQLFRTPQDKGVVRRVDKGGTFSYIVIPQCPWIFLRFMQGFYVAGVFKKPKPIIFDPSAG